MYWLEVAVHFGTFAETTTIFVFPARFAAFVRVILKEKKFLVFER